MEIESLLINETQLGAQLSQCVHEKRRSDFSLMLAMLSQDVRDFSEFHQVVETKADKKVSDDNYFRNQFDLPAAQPLALNALDDIVEFNQVDTLLAGQIDDIRLKQCLKPNAIAFRDDKSFIPSNIKANLTLCQQQRLADNAADSIAKTPSSNVSQWLKSVKSSQLTSDSLSLHNIA